MVALVVAVPVVVGASSALAGTAPRPVGAKPDTRAAASAVALKGYQIVESSAVTATAGEQTGGSASCPSGAKVVGGGAVIAGSSLNQNINASYPSTAGWVAYVDNTDSTDGTFYVYAECVAQVRTYSLVDASADNPAGGQIGAVATCPSGTAVLGGGGYGSSTENTVNLNSSTPDGNGWEVYVNNASSDDDTAVAIAICGAEPQSYSMVNSSSLVSVRKGKQGYASVTCPAHTQVLSGGGYSNSGSTTVDLNSSFPLKNNVWRAFEDNGSTSTTSLSAYAVCAKTTTSA